MQFITTGDRIATENFTLGKLYTVTFTNGNYFVNTCIGIGKDYVMFQQEAPKMLFVLNMRTAANVDTIDESGGGAGTMNYNELDNKPQIGGVTLQGNKSLSDLGIASASDLAAKQDVINDLDTIRSGAAAGATAVQPAALDSYQPLINDLDTIRSGAAAGATAVQPAALASYQTLIDSSHKLSSDLVDDTGHDNKFATAAQLAQIETNKNNILKCSTYTDTSDTGTFDALLKHAIDYIGVTGTVTYTASIYTSTGYVYIFGIFNYTSVHHITSIVNNNVTYSACNNTGTIAVTGSQGTYTAKVRIFA